MSMTWKIRFCKICGYETNTQIKIQNHVFNNHKLAWKDYVIQTSYNGICPTCKCGCKRNVKFFEREEKFCEYCHGHNKIILSSEARKRIGKKNSENLKKYYKQNPKIALKKAARMREFITEETLKKRHVAIINAYQNQTSEQRNKMSKRSKQFWKDHPEIRVAASKKCQKTYQERLKAGDYDEMKRHLSKIMIKKLTKGERIWQTGIYHAKKTQQICRYKSSYELSTMIELDKLNNIIAWKYEPIHIPYIDEVGQQRNYVPDFVVEIADQKFLIEVKPRKFQSTKRNIKKFESAIEYSNKNKMKFKIYDPIYDELSLLLKLNES